LGIRRRRGIIHQPFIGAVSMTNRREFMGIKGEIGVATRVPLAAWLVFLACGLPIAARGHVQITNLFRVGAAPNYAGSGWLGQCFLNLPDDAVGSLLQAEAYADKILPDFTFRTDWIDFPAGSVNVAPDASFETLGDFLNDYITEVSDPSKLDEPFGNLLLRFRGLLKVSFADDVDLLPGLPIWVEFGTSGYDGYRTVVGETIYRRLTVSAGDSFYHENCIVETPGLFPIEITYYNRYDRDGSLGAPNAGIELYSWHGGGLPWPTGAAVLVHEQFGPATIVPPRVIYQPRDILPLIAGDYDADGDIDLGDFRWMQVCWTGTDVRLPPGSECRWLDLDKDEDIDGVDLAALESVWRGP